MAWDDHSNFAFSRVTTPPSPAISGTSLTVSTGDGALFPTPPFNCTVWPQGQNPTASNAEIVRVTAIVGDVFTISRAQEGTAAIAIGNNNQIANTITNKVIEDIETAISNIISAGGGGVSVISAELASVDARVTSVETHVNAVSDAVSVISQQVSALSQAHSVLSNRVSAVSSQVSVVSDAVTSVDSRLNALSDLHSVLSQRVSVLSSNLSLTNSALGSVDAKASIISDRVTSISAQLTSINTVHNTLSNANSALSDRVTSISAQLVSLAGLTGGTFNKISMQNVDASAVSPGMAVYAFTSANTFKRADASATGTELVLGLVADAAINVSAVGLIQTFGTVSLTSAQWSDVTSVGTGLTPGDIYYLHSTPGRMTTTQLSAPAVRHIIGQAISPNQLQLMLTPFDDDTSAFNALSERVASLEAVSALNVSASAVVGLQNAINALSDRISASGGGSGSVTSNEASAISHNASVNNASIITFISGVSSRSAGNVSTHGLQSVINALSNRMSVTDALLSNAISAGSATASAICALLSGISARSALSATVSTHGLQSVVDALSNRISLAAKAISDIISAGGGGVSVTSNELSAASHTASVANQSIVNFLSALTVRTSIGGATSVKGIQSALNALSNQTSDLETSLRQTSLDLDAKISTLSEKVVSISAQIVSVDAHANAASAAATSVDGRVNSVNTALSGLSVRSVGDVSTHGLQSVLNALSNRISAGGGTGSVTSNEASAISHNASVNNQSIVNFLSALTVRTSVGGATSVKGIQSALDALSNQTSDLGVSLRQTSLDLDAKISTLSDKVVSISAQIVSVEAHVNALCAAISAISARSAISATVSTRGLQSLVDALSNRISINAKAISDMISAGGGGVSVTSNEASAISHNASVNNASIITFLSGLSVMSGVSATVSTHGVQSVLNALSNRISINHALISNAISAGSATASAMSERITSVFGRIAVLAADTNVSAGTLTTIAGLSAVLSIGGIYEMRALVAYTASVGQLVAFGLNFGGMAHAAGYMRHTNIGQDSNQSTTSTINAAFDETGGGSLVLSLYTSVGGGGGTKHVEYNGMFVVSTSAPDPMHLLAKASSGTGQIVLKKGSFLRLFKIG